MTPDRAASAPPAIAHRRIRAYEALIFATGAVTLSLEVLASRIMTPYFGVSLYIWSGILSITLVFLALGYRLGGQLSARLDGETLEFWFLAAPIASSVAITGACALYPLVFPVLSEIDLVLGSFLGGALILALPLVALSAMNPMLISLAGAAAAGGDGGAGRVFFISTIGSVAGVLVTAFLFIPNQTNFRALLLLGLALAGAVVGLAFGANRLAGGRRRRLIGACLVAALLAGALLVGQKRYLQIIAEASPGPFVFEVRAEYTSMFGNVKVVDVRQREPGAPAFRAYIQDGMVQNRTTVEGVSLSLYTHVLEALARAYAPEARDALVLGLAAGVVPQSLKRRGVKVSVIEINADALKAATEFFGFVADGINLRWEDARTFVRRCRNAHDLVVIDLFHGDGTPDYLLTAEFFGDVKRCLRPTGTAVMNAFFDGRDDHPNRRLLATVAAAFPRVVEFRDQASDLDRTGYNGFIVGTSHVAAAPIGADFGAVPRPLIESFRRTLASGRTVDRRTLLGAEPVTDDHNVFALLNAAAQLAFRRSHAGYLPPHVLVN